MQYFGNECFPQNIIYSFTLTSKDSYCN